MGWENWTIVLLRDEADVLKVAWASPMQWDSRGWVKASLIPL